MAELSHGLSGVAGEWTAAGPEAAVTKTYKSSFKMARKCEETSIEASRLAGMKSIMPLHIDANGWVVFHGTSEQMAEKILTDGFRTHNENTLAGPTRKLVETFRDLAWTGMSNDGF